VKRGQAEALNRQCTSKNGRLYRSAEKKRTVVLFILVSLQDLLIKEVVATVRRLLCYVVNQTVLRILCNPAYRVIDWRSFGDSAADVSESKRRSAALGHGRWGRSTRRDSPPWATSPQTKVQMVREDRVLNARTLENVVRWSLSKPRRMVCDFIPWPCEPSATGKCHAGCTP
jgi:hypothetical protein